MATVHTGVRAVGVNGAAIHGPVLAENAAGSAKTALLKKPLGPLMRGKYKAAPTSATEPVSAAASTEASPSAVSAEAPPPLEAPTQPPASGDMDVDNKESENKTTEAAASSSENGAPRKIGRLPMDPERLESIRKLADSAKPIDEWYKLIKSIPLRAARHEARANNPVFEDLGASKKRVVSYDGILRKSREKAAIYNKTKKRAPGTNGKPTIDIKKRRRMSALTKALKEIKLQKKHEGFVFRRRPFHRLIREVAQEQQWHTPGIRFQGVALTMLQTIAEDVMTTVMTDADQIRAVSNLMVNTRDPSRGITLKPEHIECAVALAQSKGCFPGKPVEFKDRPSSLNRKAQVLAKRSQLESRDAAAREEREKLKAAKALRKLEREKKKKEKEEAAAAEAEEDAEKTSSDAEEGDEEEEEEEADE